MKTIITGDLHFSHNPRDAYRFAFMEWLIKRASKERCRVIIAGDLTEEKDRHPAVLVNKVVGYVHALAQVAHVDIVEGNHDYRDEGNAFFHFLNRIQNTRWISRPTILADNVLALPHSNDARRAWADIELSDHPIIVCHQTFNNSNVGFGRKLDGLPPDIIPRNSTAYCGDIHVPQTIGKNIVCIGAPYHVDFGDDYKARIIELDKGKCVSVDTSSLPQKRGIDCDGSTRGIHRALQGARKGDICQITVAVESLDGWAEVRTRVQQAAERLELIVWAIKPKLMHKAIRRNHKVVDTQTDGEIVDAFAKRHGLDKFTRKMGHKLCG